MEHTLIYKSTRVVFLVSVLNALTFMTWINSLRFLKVGSTGSPCISLDEVVRVDKKEDRNKKFAGLTYNIVPQI